MYTEKSQILFTPIYRMNRQIVLMLLMAMRFCTRVHAGILSTQSGVEPGVGREPPADSLRKTVGTGTKDIAGALVDPGTKGKTVSTNLGSQVDPGIAGSNSSDGQQWPRTAPVNAEGAADLRAMDVSGQGIMLNKCLRFHVVLKMIPI